jgi:hypothetical protein
MVRTDKHCKKHPIYVCLICHVKGNHISKVYIFCMLASMALEHIVLIQLYLIVETLILCSHFLEEL